MVSKRDREKYSETLDFFAEISRTRGKKIEDFHILECIKILEYFEEYEKCKILQEILKEKRNEK